MNRKIILTLAIIMSFTTLYVNAASVSSLEKVKGTSAETTKNTGILDKNTIYYPNATVKSAVTKYKKGNYTGCLQELFSVTKKNPSNALAYYYMAMAYTHLNMSSEAIAAYEKVLSLNPNQALASYAAKGKDCLTNGPLCQAASAVSGTSSSDGEQDELDKFINAPYGNGLSSELTQQVKQKQLTNIKETINNKDNLEYQDIEKLKNFDNNKSDAETIKIAQVSDEEILNAVKTLKDAGLNVTVGSETNYNQYSDPRVEEMSMLLGGNNYNNNNSMMNMIPFLMKRAENGENIDPRLMQTMMMSSMMSDLNFNSNNNNNY